MRDADATTQAHTLAHSAQYLALIGREMAQAEQLASEAMELLGGKPVDVPTLPFAFALIREHVAHATAVAAFDPAMLSARAKLAHAELVRATLTA